MALIGWFVLLYWILIWNWKMTGVKIYMIIVFLRKKDLIRIMPIMLL